MGWSAHAGHPVFLVRGAELSTFRRQQSPGSRRPVTGPRVAFVALALSCLAGAAAQAGKFEPEFRTLALGLEAKELPTTGYEGFACGSNGGPPRARLRDWTEFAKCPADGLGLREVYVEFGTEIGRVSELFKEQFQQELWLQRYGGTRVANFPVVMSLLFDDQGIVRAFRAVTDSRASVDDRGKAYLLRFRLYPIYGSDGWNCVDREPAPGETGVGRTYLNQLCTKEIDGKWLRIEGQFFRRPGQTGVDDNGEFVPGQFQSMTRWEVYDASLPRPQ